MAAPFKIRSRGRADLLLAVAAGIEMQLELLLADGPAALAARRPRACGRPGRRAGAAAARAARRGRMRGRRLRRVRAAAERRHGRSVVSFFALLFIAYSLGAHTDGRRLALGVVFLLGAGALAIGLDGGGAGRRAVPRDDHRRRAGAARPAGPRPRAARAGAAREGGRARGTTARRDAAVVGGAGADRRRAAPDGLVRARVDDRRVGRGRAARAQRSRAAAAASLEAIESRGRDALGEIRLLLGVLRREDDVAALEPLPSLTHLDDLVARARGVRAGGGAARRGRGARAARGARPDRVPRRPGGARRGAARPAAGGTRPCGCATASASCCSTSPTPARAPAATGRGLLGVHERVALYGGELVAESLGTGGHAVRARLPLERAR